MDNDSTPTTARRGASKKRDEGGERIISNPGGKLKTKKGTAFQESRSRIHGHNFAIRLLQTLEARLHLIIDDFCVGEGVRKQHSTLDRVAFVSKMMAHVKAGPSNLDERSWLLSMPEADIEKNIGEVFDSADTSDRGRISFATLMSYIIDCSRYGEVGAVQEAIPEYVGTQGSFFLNLDEISKAKYCPELSRVLVSGKSIGIVATQTLHAKALHPYPHLNSAADKFSCCYDLDYISHMNAVAFVGTDLAIDFIHCDTGQPMMHIPTKQTYSVCSYDRSTHLLLAGRDNIVETYGLQEYRTSDARYTVGRSLEFHTADINCIRPLQRGGLLATGSADKTVAISDLEAGELITTFKAHQHSVHHVEYIEHLNLMMSCAFDTEPKVWMLASSAMRSEAFTLRDVENPHTGVVVCGCSILDTPQVCTLDNHGAVKLWDIRMFRCQQTIRVEKTMDGIFDAKTLKWHSLVWDPSAGELVAFAQRRAQKMRRKVMTKEEIAKPATLGTAGSPKAASPEMKKQVPTAQSKLVSMADESPIVTVVFEQVSQTIATLSERKIRIWDLFTGHQEAIFDKIIPMETTASSLCISSNGKIFFLGLRNGRITSHQYSSGTIISTIVEEGGPEVVSMSYCANGSAFCAVTWRGARIYIDHHSDNTTFFPDSQRGSEVKGCDFDPLMSVLVTAERKGYVSLWESRGGKFTVSSTKAAGSVSVGVVEVSCATQLTGYPVLAVATHVGGLQLFTTTPHPVPNRKFAEALFKGREITSMTFYPPKCVIFCGDDTGWIHAFDVRHAFETINCLAPSTSWPQMMNTVGRLGVASRDITLLRTSNHVYAHSEPIVSLLWPPGCNVLISAASDQRVLLWDLNLNFIGELDPLSETGRYALTLVVPPVGFEYITTPASGECLLYSSANPLAGTAAMTVNADNSSSDGKATAGSGAFSAAKFAEDVHRVAIALEAFVPTVTTKERDVVKELAGLGVEKSLFSATYGKRAKPMKESSSEGAQSSEQSDDGRQGASIYSPNSSGVACRSLFSPSPNPDGAQPKKVVVDQQLATDSLGCDAVSFTVTRNFPLPPTARRDRDWLIRQIQMQEEQEQLARAQEEAEEEASKQQRLAHAANRSKKVDPNRPKPEASLQQEDTLIRQLTFPKLSSSVIGSMSFVRPPSGGTDTSLQHSVRPQSVDSNPRVPQNDSIISQIQTNSTRQEALALHPFFQPNNHFETVGSEHPSQLPQEGNSGTLAGGGVPTAEDLRRFYRTLLPRDLLKLRNQISQRKRIGGPHLREGTPSVGFTATEQRVFSRQGAVSLNSKVPIRTGTPQQFDGRPIHSSGWDSTDSVEWNVSNIRHEGPAPQQEVGRCASSMVLPPRQNSQMLRTQSNVDVHRRPFCASEIPSIGFGSLGIRSLTPMFAARTAQGTVWSKVHSVPQDVVRQPVESLAKRNINSRTTRDDDGGSHVTEANARVTPLPLGKPPSRGGAKGATTIGAVDELQFDPS